MKGATVKKCSSKFKEYTLLLKWIGTVTLLTHTLPPSFISLIPYLIYLLSPPTNFTLIISWPPTLSLSLSSFQTLLFSLIYFSGPSLYGYLLCIPFSSSLSHPYTLSHLSFFPIFPLFTYHPPSPLSYRLFSRPTTLSLATFPPCISFNKLPHYPSLPYFLPSNPWKVFFPYESFKK